MPGKRKSSLGRKSVEAKRKRDARVAESLDQRDTRLAAVREQQAASRRAETVEQRETRLALDRALHAASRATETKEERAERLASQRGRQAVSRDVETAEERAERLASQRGRQAVSRDAETAEERAERLASQRGRQAVSRDAETAEERAERLASQRERQAVSRDAETAEERAERLATQRGRQAVSRDAETAEERAERLASQRGRQAVSRDAETAEERAERQASQRGRQAVSRDAETAEERAERLVSQRGRQAVSRDAETAEERAERLASQRGRQAVSRDAETAEERAERLASQRRRQSTCRAAESGEVREERLQTDRLRRALRREDMSEDERLEFARSRRENYAETRRREDSRRENLRQSVRERRISVEDASEVRRPRMYLRWVNKEGSGYLYDPLIDYKAETDVGPMNVVCTHCNALKWRGEPTGMCCSGGKVRLPPLGELPEPLNALLMDTQDGDSKHFLSNIRAYNSAFMMTSFGVTGQVTEGGFKPTFKVRGQVYHRIGSLLPPEGVREQFLQLYFVADERSQATMRMTHVPKLREDLVIQLQQMLHHVNPLVNLLKMCMEDLPQGDTHKIVIRADRVPRGEHAGRYNQPTVDEVAIVLVGQEHDRGDIILKKRQGGLSRISETHRSYDALQYPLMFPNAEDGYHLTSELAASPKGNWSLANGTTTPNVVYKED